jgi:hypothetical protein
MEDTTTQDIFPNYFISTYTFNISQENYLSALWTVGKMWIQSRERACTSMRALRAVEMELWPFRMSKSPHRSSRSPWRKMCCIRDRGRSFCNQLTSNFRNRSYTGLWRRWSIAQLGPNALFQIKMLPPQQSHHHAQSNVGTEMSYPESSLSQ